MKKNFPRSNVFLFTIFTIILFTGVFSAAPFLFADHDTVTFTLNPGTETITFRDVENLANASATVSTDKPNYNPGDTITITVVDDDSNVNLNGLDSVTIKAFSDTSFPTNATATLTETGSDTDTFSGTILLSSSTTTSGSTLESNSGDDITIEYVEEDEAVGRFSADLVVTGGSGTVTLSDNIITSPGEVDCPVILVTHPVIVDLSGAVTTGDITVTMSYANALLGSAGPANLKMYWAAIGATNFVDNPLTPPGDLSGHSVFNFPFTGTKITNIDQPPAVEGQYALGFDAGCAGGGGGGLVRPGLVVNALAGLSAALGGGGSGPPGPTVTLGAVALSDSGSETISMPPEIREMALNHDPYVPLEPIEDIYEDFDLPLSINENGFVLGGYENTLVTQTIQPGEQTEFKVVYYTNSELAHSELNFNLGLTRTIQGSNTQVILEKDNLPQIIDPDGNIASFTGSIDNEDDLKRVATFLVTFSETAELPNHDMVIRTWTTEFSSGDTIVYDAIQIAQPEIVEVSDEDLPEPEIQSLKSQHIPIWIKNNAAWWSQELIEDSDFVAGIEYLIQNEIITLEDNQLIASSYSSNEIPEWIKNTAGWWSNDLITEKEFTDGLQWLINNGIIRVTDI